MMPYCKTNLDLTDVMGLAPILLTDFTISSISVPNADYETDLFSDYDSSDAYRMIYDATGAAQRISAFIYEESSPYWEQYGDTSQETDASSAAGD